MAVFKTAFGTPARFRVIELDAANAVLAQSRPDSQHVFLKIRIGVIETHQRFMVPMKNLQAADFIEKHVARKSPRVIVRGHANLKVSIRNAIACLNSGTPFGKGVVRRHQMTISCPVGIIPPTLFCVSIIVTIGVRFQSDSNLGVFGHSGFLCCFEFPDKFYGIVDPRQFAHSPHRPSAQHWKVIDIRMCVIGQTHGPAILFQCDKWI